MESGTKTMVNQVNTGFQQPSSTSLQTSGNAQTEGTRSEPRANEPQAERDAASAESQRSQEQFNALQNNNQINQRERERDDEEDLGNDNRPRGSLVDIEA